MADESQYPARQQAVYVSGYFVATFTLILTIAFWAHSFDSKTSVENQYSFFNESKNCKTEIDSLTKKIIYVTVDKEAANIGGQIALFQQFGKITLDSIPEDFDTRFIVAFVVDTAGQINGDRIIKDKAGNVGQKMLTIAKSFKWTPAECNGRKVPMLAKLSFQMCLQEN